MLFTSSAERYHPSRQGTFSNANSSIQPMHRGRKRLLCPVLHCPTLSYTVLHCPTLSYTVLHCPTLSYTVLHCPTLSYTVLHCPTLSCTVLHCHAQQIISPTSLAPNILHTSLLIQRVVNTWQGVRISHSPCINSSNIPETRQHIFSS